MANQVEIVIKATDEASAVLKQVEGNAQQSLGGVEAAAESSAKGLALIAGAATAAVAGVVAMGHAFASSLSSLVGYAEGLEKARLATGVSIDFWQRLTKTGEEMGISFDQIRGAVERMEKSLEGSGAALGKFGINVKDFADLDADEKVRALAAQIMAIQDPSERAAVAMAATGRSGAEMIPIFAAIVDGSVDLQSALGQGVVDSLLKVDKASDHAATAWKTLKQELVAFIAQQLPLESFFTKLADGLTATSVLMAQWPGFWEAMRKGAFETGRDMVLAAEKVRDAEAQRAAQLPKTSAAVMSMMETNRKLNVGLAELVKSWDEDAKAAKRSEASHASHRKETERVAEQNKKTAVESEAAAKKYFDWIAAQQQKWAKDQVASMVKAAADARRMWEDMAQAAANSYEANNVAARTHFFTTRAEMEQTLRTALAAYDAMLAKGTATYAQLQAAHTAVKQAEADLNAKSNVSTIQGLTMVADSASSILRSLFGKSKAAAIAAAIIDTIAAVVKTLAAYPFPWSLAPAAAVAAAGYAQVQKIRSSDAGFAQGTPGTAFLDFGRGSPTVLHGEEAVVTRTQGESVASMVRDALADGRAEQARRRQGPSMEPIVLQIDGQVLGRWIMRRSKAGLMPLAAY